MKISKLKYFFIATSLCLLFNCNVFYAQSEDLREQRRMETLVNRGQSTQIPLPPAKAIEDQIEREAFKRKRARERDKLISEINKKYEIPTKYLAEYGNVLRSKKFESARLFPDTNCFYSAAVSVEELERCKDRPQVIGGGSRYSFRFMSIPEIYAMMEINAFFRQADIHFIGDKLIVGTNNIQNIIVEIGDVKLEQVNKKSAAVKFLDKFKIVDNRIEFDKQKEILIKGVENDGLFYTNKISVKRDTTYILRSVAYLTVDNPIYWIPDQTIAFRIIGKEPDGSIVILWKKLKEDNKKQLLWRN